MARFKFYALWLCLICIGVFILQTLIRGFTDMFILDIRTINNFEFWRLFTSIFLHGGVAHLFYNLFALALFGSILERLIGSRKFLIVFLFSGIFANLVSVNFYSSSLGASGAIYGILGCLALLRPGMMVWAFGFPMPMFMAAILWTAGSVLGIFIPSNIGYIAHLSGIIAGFLFGFFLKVRKKEIKNNTIEISEEGIERWEKRYLLRNS